MKPIFCSVLLITFLCSGNAAPTIGSELETFSKQPGAAISVEGSTIYKFEGNDSLAGFRLDKLTNTSTAEHRFGIGVWIYDKTRGGRYGSGRETFIDADEIDGFIKALAYFSKMKREQANSEDSLQAYFHTRSGLKIHVTTNKVGDVDSFTMTYDEHEVKSPLHGGADRIIADLLEAVTKANAKLQQLHQKQTANPAK